MKLIITENDLTIEDASIYDIVYGLAASYAICFDYCENDRQKRFLKNLILETVTDAIELGLNHSSDNKKNKSCDVSMLAKMIQKMQEEG